MSFFLRDLTPHGRWPRVADVVSGARRDPRARSVHHGYVFPRPLRLVLHRVASDDRPAPFKRPTLAGGTRRRGPRSVRPRGRLDLPRRGHQLLLPRVLLGRRGWLVRARVGRRGARRGPGPEAERRQSLEFHDEWWERERGLQTAPGVYNERFLVALDKLIVEASRRGLRLLLCLTNYWEDYGAIRGATRHRGSLTPLSSRKHSCELTSRAQRLSPLASRVRSPQVEPSRTSGGPRLRASP